MCCGCVIFTTVYISFAFPITWCRCIDLPFTIGASPFDINRTLSFPYNSGLNLASFCQTRFLNVLQDGSPCLANSMLLGSSSYGFRFVVSWETFAGAWVLPDLAVPAAMALIPMLTITSSAVIATSCAHSPQIYCSNPRQNPFPLKCSDTRLSLQKLSANLPSLLQ